MKKRKFNLILCAASVVLLVLYVLCVDGADNIIRVVRSVNLWWILAALGCMLAYWLLESLCLHTVAKSIYPRQRLRSSVKVSLMGQYFNCITPCASGGQPVQAYYMVKYGFPLGSAMTALVAKFIVFQVSLTVFSAAMLALRFQFFAQQVRGFMAAVLFGFFVTAMVIVALLLVAFFKKPTLWFAVLCVKVLAKLRIVKQKGAAIAYVEKEIDKFRDNVDFIKKNIPLLLKMFVISMVQHWVYFLISYLIYRSFGFNEYGVLTLVASQSFVSLTSSFSPLPGSMLAAEGAFFVFFRIFFGQTVNMAMLIWRLLTFYLPIMMGVAITFFEKGTPEPLQSDG